MLGSCKKNVTLKSCELLFFYNLNLWRENCLIKSGGAIAKVLENVLLQNGVEELPAAIDTVDGSVFQEGIQAAATEAQGEIRALQAFFVLPVEEIVGRGIVPDPVGEAADGKLWPSHEGR